MTKKEFLSELEMQLHGLPKQDIEDRVLFYSEIIDDKMEEGLSEEDAVFQLGSAQEIAKQIIADTPLLKIVKSKKMNSSESKWWFFPLLIIAFPVVFALLASGFAVFISLYAVIFSLVIGLWAVCISIIASLWAVFASFIACAIGGFFGGVILSVSGDFSQGLALIACGLVCVGFVVLSFKALKIVTKGLLSVCKIITNGSLKLYKVLGIAIKKCFIKRG